MPYDFPNAPTSGQTTTMPDGSVRQWDGVKWHAGAGTTTYLPANLVPQEVVYGAASGGGAAQDAQLLWDPTDKALKIGANPAIQRLLRNPNASQYVGNLSLNLDNPTGAAWVSDNLGYDSFALQMDQHAHTYGFWWSPAGASLSLVALASLNSSGAWSTTATAHRFRYLVSAGRASYTGAGLALTAGAWNVISFTTVDYDTDGMWTGGTSSFTAPVTGYYICTGQANVTSALGANWMSVALFKSGGFAGRQDVTAGYAGGVTMVLALTAGDYVQLRVNPTVAVTVAATTFLQMFYLGE
jgi:hypothetical protein